MAIVSHQPPHVRFISRDGQVWLFHSLNDLAQALAKAGKHHQWQSMIGRDFWVRVPGHTEWANNQAWQYHQHIAYKPFEYIIRHGSDVVEFSQLPWTYWRRPIKQPQHQHTHRQDAVQGTGRWKNSHPRRQPQTLHDKRWNSSDEHDGYVRRARSKVHLPSGWDMPYRKGQRSWKKYRRTQWKD